MNETEEERLATEMTKKAIEESRNLKEETANKKWTRRSNTNADIAVKTAAFQLAGIVISQLFEPLDFDKKFRIVIEHDPDDETGNVYIKYYD